MTNPHADAPPPASAPDRPRPAAQADDGVPEYAVAYICHNFPARLPADELRALWLTVENRGKRPWEQGSVKVAVDLNGVRCVELELPHSAGPGERVTLHWTFRLPGEVGRHEFKFELMGQGGTTFGQHSVPPLYVPFEVTEQPATYARRLRDFTLETCSWYWFPADEGISWSSTGRGYPVFAREARGCRITDLEGRRYVDYLMGWGCALLGYAHERVGRAVANALGSGPLLSMAHHLMPEVAEALCKRFPGAGAVTFGKNGSDVCTAAVRLARAHTGRPLVLTCGYHGWQDWYVEQFGFASTGVPERGEQLVLPFEFNNLEQVAGLLSTHRGRVAAVMLEPAGPVEGPSGPVKDADPAFLREMTALAHRDGALVIFDEIMTGFRYPGGSVQSATGVVPDLTCLGKALSNGMPLSALVGRKEVFHSCLARIFYEPTFKGEVYSFAAAREALNVYQEQDVPAHVWDFGNRLRAAVNRICRDLGVSAEVIGPPFRMLLAFAEADGRRRTLMRTLVQQELFKQGVLTCNNLLLPSAAHDDEALGDTCRAFEHALRVLAEAMEGDRFASYLEVPPLPA